MKLHQELGQYKAHYSEVITAWVLSGPSYGGSHDEASADVCFDEAEAGSLNIRHVSCC